MQLLLLVPLALTFTSSALAGRYQSTCWDCDLANTNTLLGCFCRKADGSSDFNIIDLNTCLLNDRGAIRPLRNGGFGGSCRRDGDLGDGASDPCWICGDGSGGEDRSCPCLDCWISNQNGVLSCDY